ncbi:Uncharacterised protein [Mycobacteroides abscessus subsp. abscessus]|nr:Uncharacterised protein [Mycobacteroides abscessus subsp. abscessus]
MKAMGSVSQCNSMPIRVSQMNAASPSDPRKDSTTVISTITEPAKVRVMTMTIRNTSPKVASIMVRMSFMENA